MLILLPPSETKRSGGSRRPLDLASLAFPALSAQRQDVVSALIELSDDADAASRVLKLSDRQRGEVDLNARLRASETLPAVDRYTGVLYDSLDASSLDAAARRWLGRHVAIHSAPFGPVGALDRIPSYRLGATASLPGLPSLKKVWARPVTAELVAAEPGFILDLRSEAYVALGPIAQAPVPSVFVRVVTEGADGATRALNHFNKHAKGALVRALATDRPRVGSLTAFVTWARGAGLRVEDGAPGEVLLYA